MHCFFCTIHAAWPWLRQTSDGCGGMGPGEGTRFVLEDKDCRARWLAVFDEPPPGARTRAPRERRVLFVTEPPEIKRYPRSYLEQFGTVISPYPFRGVDARALRLENPCLNWQYGVVTGGGAPVSPTLTRLGDIENLPVPRKSKKLSVICSDKTATEAQRRRIRFVRRLKELLGDELDVFGRGFRPVADKAEAIAPYKYHLVLENNYLDNFWTEKLSDAWIGWALPLYLGAPNLAAVCEATGGAADGFLALDPEDEAGNMERIARCLRDNLWEERREALARCRAWCLRHANVFARLTALIDRASPGMLRPAMLEGAETLYGTDRKAVAALYARARR
ncbi:glycosyltransferase family 10 domain-containing protein [Desulfovibrio sp. SGI.169]|uniref:glycosyltransferase family 10 domain-containing protein n=1 Tax=Desulfovibrio sp. SGI.169 TaxID=3420561 RepID=UPI003CFEB30D